MKTKLILAALVGMVLVGCSTTQIATPKLTGPNIVVIRDKGFTGSGCDAVIFLDGLKIGVVSNGQTLIHPTTQGKHNVRMAVGDLAGSTMCPNNEKTRIILVENAPAVFRMSTNSNMETTFDQIE